QDHQTQDRLPSVVILLLVSGHRDVAIDARLLRCGADGTARRLGGLILELVGPGDLLLRVEPFENEIDRRGDAGAPALASAVDFILEGLYAQKKITRSDEFQYQAAENEI